MQPRASMPSSASGGPYGKAAEHPGPSSAGRSLLRSRHLPQLEFLDFAGRRLRYLSEPDGARTLERGEVLSAPGDEFLRRNAFVGLELHERARSFAPFLVGHGNDGGHLDGRVLVERVLDLD